MILEHTRTHGFDASPKGTKWWTIRHNEKQYVVRKKYNSSGYGGEYEFIIDNRHGLDTQKTVKVKLTPSTAIVSASECDFVDITLAVQTVMFIKSQESD